jgi:hypothetical protein
VVVRPTAGEDILCLDVFTGLQAETTVCLGKKGAPIEAIVKERNRKSYTRTAELGRDRKGHFRCAIRVQGRRLGEFLKSPGHHSHQLFMPV